MKRGVGAALLLILSLARAELIAQTPPDTGSTVILAGRLFDSERETFLTDQNILVQRDTIAAVGIDLPVPTGARVIDLRRYTVLPGLIDTHTHLFYLEHPSGTLTSEGIGSIVVEGTALRTLRAAERGRTFLLAGITTVRDLGNVGEFGDVALRQAIEEGTVDGPRLVVSGPGLSPEGGQFPGLQKAYRMIAEDEYRVVRGPLDAAMAVRENVTYGVDLIKIYSDNAPNPGYLSLDEMRAIVEEAHRMGVKVTAHATHDASIWRAVEAGVDGIEHGYVAADSTLAFMKQRHVPLVPTDADSMSIALYASRQRPDQRLSSEQRSEWLNYNRDRLRRAIEADVTIVAGSDQYLDLGIPQGEAARRVLFAYADAGMQPVEILRAATIHAARLLDREGKIGVIKAGAFADIIAIDGDPEEDIRALEQVSFVMKNGTIYIGKP